MTLNDQSIQPLSLQDRNRMARMPRLVVPHYPHHVTQRGSRRQTTFFSDSDYRAYKKILERHKQKSGTQVCAYCLMPNHVHFIVIPSDKDGLCKMFREAHRQYARQVNKRHGWQGHLWQERFHSFVMEERHVLAAIRYTELNPVRAGICERAEQWPWSSYGAHAEGTSDQLVDEIEFLKDIENWPKFINWPVEESESQAIRQYSKSGRPRGGEEFVENLERLTGRCLRKIPPGRKPRYK